MPPSIAETRRSSSSRSGGGDVSRLNLIAELARRRRGRKPVVCSKFGGTGHNARGCAARAAARAADVEPGELAPTLDIDHEPVPVAPPPRPEREPRFDQELDFS